MNLGSVDNLCMYVRLYMCMNIYIYYVCMREYIYIYIYLCMYFLKL